MRLVAEWQLRFCRHVKAQKVVFVSMIVTQSPKNGYAERI